MTAEQDFIDIINAGSPKPEDLYLRYSQIHDPVLRVSVRTGEMILSAALNKGIQLQLPDADRGDEWLSLTAERVVEALKVHGRPALCGVLKEARNRVNRSDLNGDRAPVLEKISGLMRDVNRPVPPIVLPPIPSRH